MNLINDFLNRCRQDRKRIACVGDSMIDEYHEVSVNRISPEFPMPIMHSFSENCPIRRPGGVANVAYQYNYFNIDPFLVTFLDDKSSQLFWGYDLNLDYSEDVWGSQCPVKKRFLDNGIQVKRWDVERKNFGLSDEKLDEAQNKALDNISFDCDVVIFSDYDKGFFSGAKCHWSSMFSNAIQIVDPKNGPVEDWFGCNIFKPNDKEAFLLSGHTDWKQQCLFFSDVLECDSVVITQGGDGVVGYIREDDEYFKFDSKKQVKIESVVGAGDCFAAFFSAAIAHDFSVLEAAEIGFNAGSIYVQNSMNRPIIPAEFSEDGIVEPEDLAKRDFKLAFTNGVFDVLHSGHIQTLKFAADKAKKLVVALNSDDSVKRLKGEDRPIKPLSERMAVVSSLEMVDFVISFEEDTPLEVIKKCNPNVLVKGADYDMEKIIGADIVKEIYQAPLVEGISTTELIDKFN